MNDSNRKLDDPLPKVIIDQTIDSRVDLELDFDVDIDLKDLTIEQMSPVTAVINTPFGLELIFNDECEEVTSIMPKSILKDLLDKMTYHTPPPLHRRK